ncbi:hypothetical protein F4677DRAFT_278816 [Hypoxylon crocopeplum]|nr:hypothetical protein F4677DRAFT_278816 [Hypoxylon crocopeplum]
MDVLLYRPKPNGLGVVMDFPAPHLSEGISSVLSPVASPCAKSANPVASAIISDRTTPTSITSWPPYNSTTSTPASTITSTTSRFSNANNKVETPRLTLYRRENSTSSTQHYGLFTPTPDPSKVANQDEGLMQPRLSRGLGIVAGSSQDDNFSHEIPLKNMLSNPKPPKICITSNSSASAFTSDEIVNLYRGGVLSISAAKQVAARYQYWGLVEALERLPLLTEGETAHVNSNYCLQQRDNSHVLYLSKPLSEQQSGIDLVKERFYAKLEQLSTDTRPVHVFVDMSNIFIGFCDTFKISRRIPAHQRIKVPFSFRILAALMERGRNIQKRVLAGSMYAGKSRKSWPPYFHAAEQLQYEMNIYSRVKKRKISPNKPKRRGRTSPQERVQPNSHEVVGDSAADSSEDGMVVEVNGEQGVDENLHLNMMDVMWENLGNPGTMVLATGDAAEAEFSDGFFRYARRALDAGWKLELIAWKRTTSLAWINLQSSGEFAGMFQIIFLDDFLEELQEEMFQ